MMGFSPDGFFLVVDCSGRSGALRDVKSGAGSPSSAEPGGGGGGTASSGCSGNWQCEVLLFSSIHYPRSIPQMEVGGLLLCAVVVGYPTKIGWPGGPRPADCSLQGGAACGSSSCPLQLGALGTPLCTKN
ncbi:hypothetical protein ACP70R_006188 [Stipagrostis hirtigluma subsp. patula]